MKYTQKTSFLLALLFLVMFFAGCTQPAKTIEPEPSVKPAAQSTFKTAETSITITDMAGRQITLDKPAEKIVALTASDCEMLYAVGAGNTLVGRGEYCDYPVEVTKIPSVQSGKDTNVEQIISLKPQVVIMSKMSQTKEQTASLEAAGIKVIVSDAQNIEGVYANIQLIGAIVGKNKEAAAVVDSMKKAFEDIAAKASGKEKKTIYFEVSPLEYGLWAAGSGNFMDEMAAKLGLTNAFADVTGWGEISQEQVIKRNPDYIVTIAMYDGTGNDPVKEILSRPGWQNIKAVKNGAVLNVNSNEVARPGPRLADGIAALYDFIYKGATLKPAA